MLHNFFTYKKLKINQIFINNLKVKTSTIILDSNTIKKSFYYNYKIDFIKINDIKKIIFFYKFSYYKNFMLVIFYNIIENSKQDTISQQQFNINCIFNFKNYIPYFNDKKFLKYYYKIYEQQKNISQKYFIKSKKSSLIYAIQNCFIEFKKNNSLKKNFTYTINILDFNKIKNKMLKKIIIFLEYIKENKIKIFSKINNPFDIIKFFKLGFNLFYYNNIVKQSLFGNLFIKKRILNIGNIIFYKDYYSIDLSCSCYTCDSYNKSYLHHTFKNNILLSYNLIFEHNLIYFNNIIKKLKLLLQANKIYIYKSKDFI